jgi:hypothetical protein
MASMATRQDDLSDIPQEFTKEQFWVAGVEVTDGEVAP